MPSSRPSLAAVVPRLLAALCFVCLVSCGSEGEEDVVVYVALDKEHSERLIAQFEEETGLKVKALYDDEVSKTVGLRRRIESEKDHPRCDVFWNNEIVNTVVLKEQDLLTPYDSPSAADIPAEFRDPDHTWTGFAARARIFIVNHEMVPETHFPSSFDDLLDPNRKGEACFAQPTAGTTATHVAVLFDQLGPDAAKAKLMAAKANGLRLLSSNGMTMRSVRDGRVAYGFTDTDDYNVARLDGYPVSMVYPDQGDDQPGCLVIPNTVAIIKGGPHPDHAKTFIDWVLSKKVEEQLAHGRSAQIPVRADVPTPEHVRRISDLKVMKADFNAAAKRFGEAAGWVTETFLVD